MFTQRLEGERLKKKITFHRDRLIAALNKYWRPLGLEEYLHKMDLPATENAIAVAGFPKKVVGWIWEEQVRDGLVWTS